MWRSKRFASFLPGLFALSCTLLVLTSCPPPSNKGSLKIRAYANMYASDPSVITADTKVDAILDVTFPGGTTSTVVTDELGWYDFGSVDAGDYVVQPRYFPQSTAQTYTVREGRATTGLVIIPDAGMYFYVFNPAESMVSSLAVRQALCEAIDRAGICSAAGMSTSLADSNLIPSPVEGSWSSAAHSMTESVAGANAHLGSAGAISVGILFNTSTVHLAIANDVKGDWESLVGSGSSSVAVALNSQAWSTYLDMFRNLDFVIARSGWGFDSNNPLSLFRYLSPFFGIPYQALLNTAATALENLDLDGFEAGVVALNDYLIDEALALPMYNYYP